MQRTWVRSLGRKDPLEKEMSTHFSILAWRIPWTEEPVSLQSIGSQKSWPRQWYPTPVLLPGESHGWRSLVGYSPQVAKSWTQLSDFTFTFTFMSIESVIPSNNLILCHPLLLLPSIFPSIKVFSNESVLCIRWPEYWSFSLSISPSNEYSGLISFRMD